MDVLRVPIISLLTVTFVVAQDHGSMPTFRYKSSTILLDKLTTTQPPSTMTTQNTFPEINMTVTWTVLDVNNTDNKGSPSVFPEPEPEPEVHNNSTFQVYNATFAEPSSYPEFTTNVESQTHIANAPDVTTSTPSITTVGYSTVTDFWDLVMSMITTPFPGSKPGTCPDTHVVRKICQSRCQHDKDCMYDRKCCHDGHGYGCCSDVKAPEPTFFDSFFNVPASDLAWSYWFSK